MNLQELKDNLEIDLDNQFVNPSVLLDKLTVINEESRKTSSYVDPRYIPFYYYLGKYIKPKKMIEIGFGLGFFSTCFLKSCDSVEYYLGFQEKTEDFFTPRFAIRNIKSSFRKNLDHYYGHFSDSDFQKKIVGHKWDIVFFNEETSYDKHLFNMDSVWDIMDSDGYLVVDYVESNVDTKEVFNNFCKIHNRTPIILKTRYGVGIIQK